MRTAALIALPVILLILGVGGFLLLRDGGEPGSGGGNGEEPSEEVPAFSFKVIASDGVPTTPTEGKKLKLVARKYTKPAEEASAGAARALSAMFTDAFLDPAHWREGAYDSVWRYFLGPAQHAARGDGKALTAGAAGDLFTTIQPGRGNLRSTVLFDPEDRPVAIEVDLSFSAVGEADDGSVTRLVSTGRYLLEPAGNSWRIVSYDVQRKDKQEGIGADASPSEEGA